MLLGEVVQASGATLLRCGYFENLGFICDYRDRMLTFLESEHFLRALEDNPLVTAVITKPSLSHRISDRFAVAVCDHPRLAFTRIHNHLRQAGFYWADFATAIHPEARVHASAWIAEKNVRIGPGTTVGPRAIVLERCETGEDCNIGAGSILGGVGLQTARAGETLVEMQHAGGLLLRDRVHVLPGAVIATGLFRHNTDIGNDARIGAQSFVSHGVQVGHSTFIGHGAVINGNVSIGCCVWIGPGAVVTNNLQIGDSAVVSLGSVVIRDVARDTRVSGNFAEPHRALLRRMAQAGSGR
jgi:UDP-3-O-[3-hydroxymyristoyl] glucosamine N-acyltransferase